MSQNLPAPPAPPAAPPGQPLAWYWASLLGVYLITLVLLLAYLLYMLWPPSPRARDPRGQPRPSANQNAPANANTVAPLANANTAPPTTNPGGTTTPAGPTGAEGDNDQLSASQQKPPDIYLFGGRLLLSHTFEVRLLLIVLLAGALGAYIHAASSFIDYVGNRKFYSSWVWWYLLRPFVGMSLALIFYFVVRGGFISPTSGGEDMNPYGIAALAGLVGMFSKQATDKLSEVFKTLFRTGPRQGDDIRQDSLQGRGGTTTQGQRPAPPIPPTAGAPPRLPTTSDE